MAHGGDPEWNRDVEAAVEPLRSELPTEIAFGMATPSTIESAVQKLEARGVTRIAVVRMFISGESFLEPTRYILGLTDDLPQSIHGDAAGHGDGHDAHAAARASVAVAHAADHTSQPLASSTAHCPADSEDSLARQGASSGEPGEHEGHGDHHMEAPRRVRIDADVLLSTEGVAESPYIDDILRDRVRALSRDPAAESVLILGHGPGDDAENERWLAAMRRRASSVGEIGPFRQVACMTLREDWPEKRSEAEIRIREFVSKGGADGGRVIVVPFRVAGFGPYEDVLAGLQYVSDGRGFCPHPNMTRWLRDASRRILTEP